MKGTARKPGISDIPKKVARLTGGHMNLRVLRLLVFVSCVPLTLRAAVLPADYARGVNDVAGFVSADGMQHAMALHAGIATEIFFQTGISQVDVAAVPAALAIDAYESPTFGKHRVLAILQTDGDVVQAWYRSDGDDGGRVLANVAGAVDVAAFEDGAGLAHVVALVAGGELVELTTRALGPVSRRALGSVAGATHIAGFLARDDGRCILIAGRADGAVSEVFYQPGGAIGVSQLAGPGSRVVDVGAFYTGDDKRRHAIVLDATGALREIFYSPSLGQGIATLGNGGAAQRVSGYVTTDNQRHVILGGPDGAVREISFGGAGRSDTRLATIGDAAPRATFVGPRLPPGIVPSPPGPTAVPPSPAGLTFALAGDEAVRYAVSLNAGVWRGGGGLPWVSLAGSPRFAQSIAVDPNDRTHVFVGERDGDAGPGPAANQAGLWESTDLGAHWSYVLDPLSLSDTRGTCASQAVPAVTATSDGGAIAATQCVVVQRTGRSGPFRPLPAFWGLGPFSGTGQTQGCGRSFVWARTLRNLVWLEDNGTAANVVAIPANAADSAGTMRQVFTADGTRGEGFGFAAYGCRAAFVVRIADASAASPRIASLEFDAIARTWRVDPVDVGSGIGLGGRIFIKAEHAAGYRSRTGKADALLMSGAQTVFLGTPNGDPAVRSSPRGIQWRAIVETPWGPGPEDHYFLKKISNVHSDLWDAHVSDHPSSPRVLIASDGGVYGSDLAFVLSAAADTSPLYQPVNQDLGAQHVHVMRLVDPSYAHRSGVLTAAVDNDSWWQASAPYASAVAPWHTGANLGDGNFVFTDPRVMDAAVVWRHGTTNGVLRSLLKEPPGLDGAQPAYAVQQFRSEHQYSVVPRTDGNETDALDFAALAHVGATVADNRAFKCDGADIPADAVDGTGWRSVVVRTPNFATNRRISLPNPVGAGWSLAAEAPQGSQRLWAANNRSHPAFFFYAETDVTGMSAFYGRKAGQAFFSELTGINAPFPIPYCAVHGPLFPNPYDVTVAWAVASDGVFRMSGDAFVPDPVLTALVTRSGTYPMMSGYIGDTQGNAGDGSGLYLKPSQARALSTLVDVAFDVADVYRVVAASAFGSLYYQDRREGIWRDLTPFLPGPGTEIASVAIAHDGVYVAMEGRSVWRVDWPELAPEATFFTPPSGASLGTLTTASGRRVPGAAVSILIPATPTQPPVSVVVHTGPAGDVPYPPGLNRSAVSGRGVRLRAELGGSLAPAFRRTVM